MATSNFRGRGRGGTPSRETEYSGRKEKDTSFLKVKNEFLNMSREEKEKYYGPGQKLVSVSHIETWEDYYRTNKQFIKKQVLQSGTFYLSNRAINERISLWQGNITNLEVDAIVNAANTELKLLGGVAGAIYKAAGEELATECNFLDGCEVGKAVITGGYKLPAKYVIHTPGPTNEDVEKLKSSYNSVLELLIQKGLRTIAIPCISTGIYGFKPDKACLIALRTVRDFLDTHGVKISRVIFCMYEQQALDIYHSYMPLVFPVSDEDYSPPSSPETKIRGN